MLKILFFVLLLFSASCRFSAPGSSETAALESKGTFSGGAPAWAKLPKEKSNVLPGRAGMMGRTHTVPRGVSMSSAANASSATAPHVGRGFTKEVAGEDDKKESRNTRKVEVHNPNAVDPAQESVISRVEYECPGTESTLVDALKTEVTQERIKKFLSLTRQCPYSAEVWVLLAGEYRGLGRYSDARRCLQAAMSIDPDHEEAKKMYNSLQGSSSTGSSASGSPARKP